MGQLVGGYCITFARVVFIRPVSAPAMLYLTFRPSNRYRSVFS